MLYVSWEEVEQMCRGNAERIKNEFKPDLILGIARGGLAPARIMSDLLDVKTVFIVCAELYKNIGKTGNLKIKQDYPKNALKGKRVLIVDDVSDTGKTLSEIKGMVGKEALEVRVATLHYKPHSIFKPDYYSQSTSDWVVYPWEKEETKRELKK